MVVEGRDGKTVRVDKDISLVKEHFGLDHLNYESMSPVIIPRGYTKDFVNGKVTLDMQLDQVLRAMEEVSTASDVVLVEGTGHVAVGSIVGLNNAKVASIIGADMVLIANGGLGSAFDELELNRILCQHYNVRVAGVIINKVLPEKLEQTEYYMRKALRQAWGVPLLACIPDRPFLGCPSLHDLQNLFGTKLLSGGKRELWHYSIKHMNLVTTNLARFLENLRLKPKRTLYMCHVTRDDLIVGFLAEHHRRSQTNEDPLEAALIVCGRQGKYQLSPEVLDLLGNDSGGGAPVMEVGYSTSDAMSMIQNYTPKLHAGDSHRVETAVEHYKTYIDFDELIRRTTSQNSSFNEPGHISLDALRGL